MTTINNLEANGIPVNTAGQVVQTLHRVVIVGRVVVLGRVYGERVGVDHPRRRGLIVLAGEIEAHPQHFGVADQLGDRVMPREQPALMRELLQEEWPDRQWPARLYHWIRPRTPLAPTDFDEVGTLDKSNTSTCVDGAKRLSRRV